MDKDKKVTIRLSDEEYKRLEADARAVGIKISTYIRFLTNGKIDRIFYDPAMTTEVRSCRSDIRSLVQDIARIRQKVDFNDTSAAADMNAINATLKAVYRKIDSLEDVLSTYKKEAMSNGNNKAFTN